jgi:hypothetical protein
MNQIEYQACPQVDVNVTGIKYFTSCKIIVIILEYHYIITTSLRYKTICGTYIALILRINLPRVPK